MIKELERRKAKALEAARTSLHDKHTASLTLSEYYGECLDDNKVWDMVKESPELNRYSIVSDPNNPGVKWTPIAYIRHNIVVDIRNYLQSHT